MTAPHIVAACVYPIVACGQLVQQWSPWLQLQLGGCTNSMTCQYDIPIIQGEQCSIPGPGASQHLTFTGQALKHTSAGCPE